MRFSVHYEVTVIIEHGVDPFHLPLHQCLLMRNAFETDYIGSNLDLPPTAVLFYLSNPTP
jgi:hypothetical protein